jgi:L-asparaginase
VSEPRSREKRLSIAVFSGPTATIQNSPALVTGAQARKRHGLPAPGAADRFEAVRAQRLAAPVKVYIEAYSAHPLEQDRAGLYAPPDGYVDRNGAFHAERTSPEDVPVHEAELRPEDGLYLLPYMARQAGGSPWDGTATHPGADMAHTRQTFYPDASRVFEEIDRFGLDGNGRNNLLSRVADYAFFRAAPSGGYTAGLPAARRTDAGSGDIAPEVHGEDFFAYAPRAVAQTPAMSVLADLTNTVQDALDAGTYDGAIWLEGSAHVEETIYWLQLLIDTKLPICGVSSQRPHGALANDGDRNIVSSVLYVRSRIWADEAGNDVVGPVVVMDEQVFTARDVQKGDARPGGYVAAGGHGGVVAAVGTGDDPKLTFRPVKRHTSGSEVNVRRMPRTVRGVTGTTARVARVEVAVKDENGHLLAAAIPMVRISKHTRYRMEDASDDPGQEVEVAARIERNLRQSPLAGFVLEGSSPYGDADESHTRVLERAVFSGMPVVRVGRGTVAGIVPADPQLVFLSGSNLTATKARLLLMACLLRFGSPPPAADPSRPTEAERAATLAYLVPLQQAFDTH